MYLFIFSTIQPFSNIFFAKISEWFNHHQTIFWQSKMFQTATHDTVTPYCAPLKCYAFGVSSA